jgi:hypothetical protein
MQRLLFCFILLFLVSCDLMPAQPATTVPSPLPSSNVPLTPTTLPEQAIQTPFVVSPVTTPKALYLMLDSGQIAQADLQQHPEVVVVHSFADVQQRLSSMDISIWIDKDALGLIPAQWLMQAPQKFCPLVVVGYHDALFAFREGLAGFGIGEPINGSDVDWSTRRIEPGFSVWILQPRIDAPHTRYTAVMRGYDQQPTIQAIFDITDPYIT